MRTPCASRKAETAPCALFDLAEAAPAPYIEGAGTELRVKKSTAIEPEMKPGDFKRWRKALKLSQKEAAEVLGPKRRVVQYYEKGERDGESVTIPKYIRLACCAVASGVQDYTGPANDRPAT